MGRRRGEIRDIIGKLLALRERFRGYRVVVVDRLSERGLTEIPVERLVRVTRDALILADGTSIPLHRVVMIVDESGKVYWSRLKRGNKEADQKS